MVFDVPFVQSPRELIGITPGVLRGDVMVDAINSAVTLIVITTSMLIMYMSPVRESRTIFGMESIT